MDPTHALVLQEPWGAPLVSIVGTAKKKTSNSVTSSTVVTHLTLLIPLNSTERDERQEKVRTLREQATYDKFTQYTVRT